MTTRSLGKMPCPICKAQLNTSMIDKIGFIGEKLSIFSLTCEKCGYRSTDVLPEKVHAPRTLRFRVEGKRINTLVARSSTATVRIPEIGAEIKPGPASQGFITPVEGILFRFKERFNDERIDRLIDGEPFTLIIEDSSGTSAIDSLEAEVVKHSGASDKHARTRELEKQ